MGRPWLQVRLRVLLPGLCMWLLVLGGCTTQRAQLGQLPAPVQEPSSAGAVDSGSYVLGISDEIELRYFYTPDLNDAAIVRPDGKISVALLGEVQAAGLTPLALQEDLKRRYEGILRTPELTVIVRKFSPPKAFVGGEVARPGTQTLTRPLTALQAVVASGGFLHGAKKDSIILLRNSGGTSPQLYKVDLKNRVVWRTNGEAGSDGSLQVASGSDMTLRDNDILYVPKTRIASTAQFFEEYVSKILPIYGNMGFSVFYEVDKQNVSVKP